MWNLPGPGNTPRGFEHRDTAGRAMAVCYATMLGPQAKRLQVQTVAFGLLVYFQTV